MWNWARGDSRNLFNNYRYVVTAAALRLACGTYPSSAGTFVPQWWKKFLEPASSAICQDA